MLRLAFDENFNNDIIRGLLRRSPELDILRVQEVGLVQVEDPVVLAWTVRENRVPFTHDVSTMTRYAYERIESGESLPGVFEVGRGISIAQAIEDILLIAQCSHEGEWEGQVRY